MSYDAHLQREHDRYFAEAPICSNCECSYGVHDEFECCECRQCPEYKPHDERDYAPTEED